MEYHFIINLKDRQINGITFVKYGNLEYLSNNSSNETTYDRYWPLLRIPAKPHSFLEQVTPMNL